MMKAKGKSIPKKKSVSTPIGPVDADFFTVMDEMLAESAKRRAEAVEIMKASKSAEQLAKASKKPTAGRKDGQKC